MNQGMKKMQKGNAPAVYSIFQAQRDNETQKTARVKETVVRNSQIQESLVIFEPAYYPFMNSESRTSNIFRTTVKVNILPHELKRIIQLNHPSLINIQKITRSRPKTSCDTVDMKTLLSFYYEEVQYSLKSVATSQKGTTYLLKRLASISIHKILTDLSKYLNSVGVSYLFDVADIGVNTKEQIKVYVSPEHFFSPCKKFTNQEITRSLDKISAWWQTTVNSHEAINPKTSNIIITNETELEDQSLIDSVSKINNSQCFEKQASRLLGFDQDENQQQKPQQTKQTITKTGHLKDSNHSIQSQCSIITSLQLQKVKKINRQIKFIRQRLNNKKKSAEETSLFAIKQKNPRLKTTADTDSLDKKDFRDGAKNLNQNPNVIQKIQQNINCINIYTNSKQSPKKNKIMKMTSQPIYSYKITPDIKAQQKANPVIVHHPSFQPEDFPNSEQDSSVDTYEMDLEAQIQPAKQVQKNKHFTPVERQISEKNYRTSHEDRNNNSKKTQNQVANKNVTGSAGPLQFKNFVNNFIKPQFLAKKSNIYEDPMQYDSQTSKSISKKKKNIVIDLYQNGRSVNSHTQKSSSLNNNNSAANQPNCKKKGQFLIVENVNKAGSPRNNIMSRTNSQIKLIQIQDFSGEKKMQDLLMKNKKGVNDSKIGQRVKTVLEKTKNAIALLNKVKGCKSPSYRQSPSQSLEYYY